MKKIKAIFVIMLMLFVGINASANTLWDMLGEHNDLSDIGGYHNLAVHTDGTPYVVYRKVTSGFYGSSFYTKVVKYDYATNTWIQLGDDKSIPSTLHVAAIAVSPDGTPYVAFSDDENYGRISVMKYTTMWETVGKRAISEYDIDTAYRFDFKIAQNGTPYIAYRDGIDGKSVTVKKFNGQDWVKEGSTLVSSEVTQKWVSLAISNKNIAYVTFTKQINSNTLGTFTKTCVLKYNGNSWVDISSNSFITPWTGSNPDTLTYPTIAVANNGTVYVAYLDSNSPCSVIVKKNLGAGWHLVGSVLDHIMYGIDVYQYPPSLALTSTGHPFVTLKAKVDSGQANSAPVTRDFVMTYNQYTDTEWKIVGSNQTHSNYLDGFYDGTAAYSSVAVDISGAPYVSFQNSSLIVKKYNHN